MTVPAHEGGDLERAHLLRLPTHRDERGMLTVGELGAQLPFVPRRFYLVHGVPDGTTRGGHGHRETAKLLVAVRGRVRVETRRRGATERFLLEHPEQALYVPPLTWSEQTFLDGGTLLVLASTEHRPAGYFESLTELEEPR